MTARIHDFLTMTRSGLYCEAGDFYLDPSRPVHQAIVTHAHADHATRNSGHIYSSRATQHLMMARHRNRILSQFHALEYYQPVRMNGVEVQTLPAGHMLGSCQVLMEHNGIRYLYTGDFKTQPDDSAEPFATVQADVLITETTFANPAFEHPEAQKEICRVNELETPVIIGAYVMGKAQRITSLLTRHCKGKRVFIHPEVSRYHEVYRASGRELGTWLPYRRREFFENTQGVCLVPPSELVRYSRSPGVYKMFATGWKKSRIACDSVLQISDHADWNDLLQVIGQVKPKEIYTLHGDGSHLRNHLAGTGIAVHLLES